MPLSLGFMKQQQNVSFFQPFSLKSWNTYLCIRIGKSHKTSEQRKYLKKIYDFWIIKWIGVEIKYVFCFGKIGFLSYFYISFLFCLYLWFKSRKEINALFVSFNSRNSVHRQRFNYTTYGRNRLNVYLKLQELFPAENHNFYIEFCGLLLAFI